MPSSTLSPAASAAVMPAASSRVLYADALRVFGAFAVVVLHVCGDGVSSPDSLSRKSWTFCLALQALCEFAVPIFVMVSGLLLLDPRKQETPGEFYGKRLRRIASPFIFWSAAYLAWRWFYEGERFTALSAFNLFFSGGAYYHLWFLTALIGLYIATPILRIVTQHASSRQLWWTAGTFIALGMGDAVVRAQDNTDFTFLFKFAPFIGYFLLGYCMRGVPPDRRLIYAGAVAWITGAGISAVLTNGIVFHFPSQSWDMDTRLFLLEEEFSPGSILMSIGFSTMVAAWYASREIKSPSKIVQSLSAASFGIYLIHPMVLSVLDSNDLGYTWHSLYVGIPLDVVVAFAGAAIITLAFMRLPVLRTIV